MADPKIPEHKLFKQGQIFGRAATTDEKIPDIAPEYRGHGATPQEKADKNKSWISEYHTLANADDQNKDESSRPQYDTYAQEMNKRLGPLASVKDTIVDGLETATKKVSGSSQSASESDGETKNSAAVSTPLRWSSLRKSMNDFFSIGLCAQILQSLYVT